MFEENGWKFVVGLEPDEPEDISDLKLLLNTPKPAKAEKKIGRNEPFPAEAERNIKSVAAGREEWGQRGKIIDVGHPHQGSNDSQ